MKTSIEQVEEFHRTFGHPVANKVNVDDEALSILRVKLIGEELEELMDALFPASAPHQFKFEVDGSMNADPVAALDALTDIRYVVDGAFLALGLWPAYNAAMDEVHNSNMSKLGEDGQPIYREDGKIMKGPNYFKPDLERVFHTFCVADDEE